MIIRVPTIICDYCQRLIVRKDNDPDGEFGLLSKGYHPVHFCSRGCKQDYAEQEQVWAEPSTSK